MRILPYGQRAVLLELDDLNQVLALHRGLRARPPEGARRISRGARTVLLEFDRLDRLARFDPGRWAVPPTSPSTVEDGPLVEIPVSYDGEDLAEVARLTGLAEREVVARHTGAEYRVAFGGFTPGWGYLTGLDPALRLPRHDTPRVRVPAGSVAIADEFTGVYPRDSPGGWRLLGRTDLAMWDPHRDPPGVLVPGARVRFIEYATAAPPAPAASPVPAASPATAGAPEAAGEPVLEILRPGPLATIQDTGRPGRADLGVGESGAADPSSLRLANALVGNPAGAAAIELTFGGLVAHFHTPVTVALAGAPCRVHVDGEAAGMGVAFDVPAGARLRIGTPASGLRTYLAVRGGIDVPPVLGSRSTDTLAGLGPDPLRPGDLLSIGVASQGSPQAGRSVAIPAEPVLHLVSGPRDDWFTPEALDLLCAEPYTVTMHSNRVACRLSGAALPARTGAQLPPEPILRGAVQVPAGGQPVLFLADHPVTGGYPVIAVVADRDQHLAGQLRPGGRVRFRQLGR
jgi:biotin-dependent carboxylase-like uncharacterized protein